MLLRLFLLLLSQLALVYLFVIRSSSTPSDTEKKLAFSIGVVVDHYLLRGLFLRLEIIFVLQEAEIVRKLQFRFISEFLVYSKGLVIIWSGLRMV
jgi:hypothetical protein